MKNVTGTCLCKSVSVSFPLHDKVFDACHCGMCRKWGGGPFLSVHGGTENVELKGEANIARYDSSDWAQRGFCKNCGTHLFYFLKPRDLYIFSLGVLNNIDDLKFHKQIF